MVNKSDRVVVLGSGPIVIGQGCEFDYSGTQACRVLKEYGLYVVLINSNPASIMTDKSNASKTYIAPLEINAVVEILKREKPRFIIATFGGQIALNLALQLYKKKILEKMKIELLGIDIECIDIVENRRLFNETLRQHGLEEILIRSRYTTSLESSIEIAEEIGYPILLRSSYTLGGKGSSMVNSRDELKYKIQNSLIASNELDVSIEEYLHNWQEFELELLRDVENNTIVICTIENIDPLGVHTGDSVTVAPAMTLTDTDYQRMRDYSLRIMDAVGLKSGGCNIQFAIKTSGKDRGRLVVIEMNPRLSRSSALASKASGYPIAKIATYLLLGLTLNKIANPTAQNITAAIEPTMDYVAVKLPSFPFRKFAEGNHLLTTSMKATGEVMALGRSFISSLHKAFLSVDIDIIEKLLGEHRKKEELMSSLSLFHSEVLLDVYSAFFWYNCNIDEVHITTGIHKWFLHKIYSACRYLAKIKEFPENRDRDFIEVLKRKYNLTNEQIANIASIRLDQVVKYVERKKLYPNYQAVDTTSGELDSASPYYYSSYENNNDLIRRKKKLVLVLGFGFNRIGQGLEFDYSSVKAVAAIRKLGYCAGIINNNPETVSTDFDISDRLFFEPIEPEHIRNIYLREKEMGDIIGILPHVGGQTAINTSLNLLKMHDGMPIIGLDVGKIELLQDRNEFFRFARDLDIPIAEHFDLFDFNNRNDSYCLESFEKLGYPVLVRPSYVIGGLDMKILYSSEEAAKHLKFLRNYNIKSLSVDKFLENAVEIDVDLLSDGEDIYICGILELIQHAGVHSGDSIGIIPPVNIGTRQLQEIYDISKKLVTSTKLKGIFNIQYIIYNNRVYVIEVNPRASRTIPIVEKITNIEVIESYVEILVENKTISQLIEEKKLPVGEEIMLDKPIDNIPIGVKGVVMSWDKFISSKIENPSTITLIGPNMKSTGEVLGYSFDLHRSYYNAYVSIYGRPIKNKSIVISVPDRYKRHIIPEISILCKSGFSIYSTQGTSTVINCNGFPVKPIGKLSSIPLYIETMASLIQSGKIDAVVNIQGYEDDTSKQDSAIISNLAVKYNVPYITTKEEFEIFVVSVTSDNKEYKPISLQEVKKHFCMSNGNILQHRQDQ